MYAQFVNILNLLIKIVFLIFVTVTDCLKLLLQHRADVNSLRQDCISPVHLAAAEGHYRFVKLFISVFNAGMKIIAH